MQVSCIDCKGYGFIIDPQEQMQDGLCSTCKGSGKINTDHKCECGRPAIQLVADTLVCSSLTCSDKALKGTSGAKSTEEQIDDFREYYRHMIDGGVYCGE